MIRSTLVAVSLAFAALSVQAQAPQPEAASAGDPPAALTAALDKLLPDQKPTSITETPVPGLYEVVVGSQLFYFSEDGRYLINGSLIDIETKQDVSATRRAEVRAKAFDALGEDQMIVFGPEDAKHTVTVFTDIDCGYCRQLHSEMKDYNDRGIRVRYVLFPRAGIPSPSYDKAVAVWCADDRQAALTEAKSGKDIPMKRCENPVQAHLALGAEMGVRGTPSMFYQDGNRIPGGYVPPEQLAQLLEQMKTISQVQGQVQAN